MMKVILFIYLPLMKASAPLKIVQPWVSGTGLELCMSIRTTNISDELHHAFQVATVFHGHGIPDESP